MFLAKIVFAAFSCTTLTNYVFAAPDSSIAEESTDQPEEEETTTHHKDHMHTFVALIDIVFTNGKKRSCTGTIIHDNVVITAAHCFVIHEEINIEPELTMSFVVIGTKNMFDTGYENYLPIERVKMHPKFTGWTADIALVYTFSGMMSDKPGTVLPINTGSSITPVDSNVTILSWGRCNENEDIDSTSHTRGPSEKNKTPVYGSDEGSETDSSYEQSTYVPLRMGDASSSRESDSSQPSASFRNQYGRQGKDIQDPDESDGDSQEKSSKVQRLEYGIPVDYVASALLTEESTTVVSRYLQSSETKEANVKEKPIEKKEKITQKHRYDTARRDSSDSGITRRDGRIINKAKELTQPKKNEYQTYFKNWRRTLGSKQNKLSVQSFSFVNVNKCKKIIEEALPSMEPIDPYQVMCYTSDDHYISDADAGAPVIRAGHLVAVTLGGAECDGDHVAVGTKMSCFCSWISENFPKGEKQLKCCKNCCNEKEEKFLRSRTVPATPSAWKSENNIVSQQLNNVVFHL